MPVEEEVPSFVRELVEEEARLQKVYTSEGPVTTMCVCGCAPRPALTITMAVRLAGEGRGCSPGSLEAQLACLLQGQGAASTLTCTLLPLLWSTAPNKVAPPLAATLLRSLC